MSSPSEIASFGHSGSQAPQLMHSSVMYVDIGRSFQVGAKRCQAYSQGAGARQPKFGHAQRRRVGQLGPSWRAGWRGSIYTWQPWLPMAASATRSHFGGQLGGAALQLHQREAEVGLLPEGEHHVVLVGYLAHYRAAALGVDNELQRMAEARAPERAQQLHP